MVSSGMTLLVFDYLTIAETDREFVRNAAAEIKPRIARATQDIFEIGSMLIDVKARLDHGQWLPWLREELGLNHRTAQRFIGVASRWRENRANVTCLPIGVLYSLIENKASDEVVEGLVGRAKLGERICRKDVPKGERRKRRSRPLSTFSQPIWQEGSKCEIVHRPKRTTDSEITADDAFLISMLLRQFKVVDADLDSVLRSVKVALHSVSAGQLLTQALNFQHDVSQGLVTGCHAIDWLRRRGWLERYTRTDRPVPEPRPLRPLHDYVETLWRTL